MEKKISNRQFERIGYFKNAMDSYQQDTSQQ